ncbi:MAG: twin-arginine translocase TatA/TatE family subunit [Bacteroidia bacterium]|jgi:sec-independent protein translocase protein TatA|nr:twin-arginine translocase TatA/TatE family subunit [Bacteroidia bacterium]MDG1720088.1 twin-arginine translocase TatA/TatE family subunit [Bacteroidia bacterium]MDG1757147.1 twin-arginine translocase TatA/TatE family subunit [Bacteroidia bacterium]CAI8201175.1 MAG: Sec-independent protein translocase protein TatA [Bacteroidia bacterium]|tara:strand:+ start:17257 stop:17466 length:210 start_codon:yes stop_codon:yes gene_type:complete
MVLFLNMGGMEWVVIIFAILLLFGGRKIPELMKGLGSGIREFNKAKNDVSEQLKEGMKEPSKSDKADEK